MSMIVLKIEIPAEGSFALSMPAGSELLSIGEQCGRPVLWYLHNSQTNIVSREFMMLGTNHAFHAKSIKVVGSIQISGHPSPLHLIEVLA